MVDFLAPDDEDEGVRWWNEQQRERHSEAVDPFDKKWFSAEVKPILIEIAASLRNLGSNDYERRNFKTKSDFKIHLYGLEKALTEAAELSRTVRQKFAERHGEEFGEPKE